MRREQLEHVLRAASTITDVTDVLVIGSQSVLGEIEEKRLPPEATASMEVDVAFFDDPDDTMADLVDGAIGELSQFHETFGYYAQGVSVRTAVLPDSWRERLVVVETTNTAPARGYVLERHDCVAAKLVAGREKDYTFAAALIREKLVDPDVLLARIASTDAPRAVKDRVKSWLERTSRH